MESARQFPTMHPVKHAIIRDKYLSLFFLTHTLTSDTGTAKEVKMALKELIPPIAIRKLWIASIAAISHRLLVKNLNRFIWPVIAVVGGVSIMLIGCRPEHHLSEVVIYTSLDRPHSQPILELFENQTGIKVRAVYDTEASKTVGLVNRLISEKSNPQADVFWNSEVLRTLVMKQKGLLMPYISPAARDIPEAFKDGDGYWTGFAARARVILINTDLVKSRPTSIRDFTKIEWRGRIAIANPLFGTTSTAVAASWAEHGPEFTKSLLIDLKNNEVKVTSGNATARDMVAIGETAACVTDTDDAFGAIFNHRPVQMIIPDQKADETGTLLIPNTVALIKNSPNPENAKKLIDFLVSSEVEELLAYSPSAQIPVRSAVPRPDYLQRFSDLKIIPVSFDEALSALPDSSKFVKEQFLQ